MCDNLLGALLDHLRRAPSAPLPAALARALAADLAGSQFERDRLLRLAAEELAPGARRWARARALAAAIARFERPGNGARTGRRPPRDGVEALLLAAAAVGLGLPGSARRLWDLLG